MKTDYTFSSTYLRTIEKKLLDKTDIDRMIGAKDASEALKVLENTNYAKEFKDSISKIPAREFRKILLVDLEKWKDLLCFLTDDQALIKLILIYFDIHNIRVFFKEKLFGTDLSDCISLHSSQKPEELKKAVYGKKTNIDKDFLDIIREMKMRFKEDSNPREVDIFTEKKSWQLHFKLVEEIGSEFLIDWSKMRVDVLNLRIVVRSFFLNRVSDSKEWFIEGGNVKTNILFKKAEKAADIQDLLKSAQSLFQKKIRQRIEFFLKEGKESSLDSSTERKLNKLFKGLADVEIEHLKESKFVLTGPEVIFSYFKAKLNANKNVRIIMKGKLNNFTSKEIAERVRIPF